MTMILSIILVVVLVSAASVSSQGNYINTCLHFGCPMSQGLYTDDLDAIISQSVPDEEFKDNIITVATYNIQQGNEDQEDWESRREELCSYLNKLQPKIFGLQEVKKHQLESLKLCLPDYAMIGRPKNRDNRETVYDPIFYRRERRLKVVKSGTFWLSKTPDVPGSKLPNDTEAGICQWARISFAERQTVYPQAFGFGFTSQNDNIEKPVENPYQKLLRYLKVYTGKMEPPRARFGFGFDAPQKIRYRLYDFYIAVTKLNSTDVEKASTQANILTKHLRNTVMDRRQFPMILLGDFGFQSNTEVYQRLERKKWLKNSMVEATRVYPAMTFIKPDDYKESLVDQIWFNKFQSLFAATMTDVKQYHRPVFAAFLKNV